MDSTASMLTQIHSAAGALDLSVPGLFQKIAIALLVGALVGIERERAVEEHRRLFAGIRTYPLIGLLGCLSALLGHAAGAWMLGVLSIGFIALVVSSYMLEARSGYHGATSEVAAILVFVLGALIFEEWYAVSIASGVVLTLFLSMKQPLQRLIARVSEEDIYATLKFAIITAIVLPVLPNETMGPLDVLNPRQVWYMVVLIAGISFAGYVLVKVFGSKRGLAITGMMGGLVSSTAVTLSFSQKSREVPDLSRTFASAIILACSIMYPRILVEIAVVNQSLLSFMWPLLSILLASGIAASLLLLFGKKSDTITDVSLQNPFELTSAIKFGLIFAVILFISKAAQIYLGESGVYMAAALAGVSDVDAITLSMANLSRSGAVAENTAAVSILIAVVVNTIVKAGIAWTLGATALRRFTLPGFGLVLLTGLLLIGWLLL
ncbi:MAG: MgtC/SapB family protein [Bacteroidia bacterium]|nr:MgtC/SapB family protein [Bacteroidia bacterium]